MPRRQAEGIWEYPPFGDVMKVAGIEEIYSYISRRQNTVAQYIATHPILDLFLDKVRRPVSGATLFSRRLSIWE